MSTLTQDSGQPSTIAQQLFEELHRYAGWLGKDSGSTRLRASVKGLGVALAGSEDVSGAMASVQADIKRLGSGAITPLLRKTMQKLRAELGDPVA